MPTGYKIRGIEPPELASYSPSVRKQFWGWVVDLGLKRKDKELSEGLDKDGKTLRPISAETRKHRRSAMTPSGKGSPSAPPLTPGYQKSRTRSLLAGRATANYAEFYWRYDAWTGDTWAVVLTYQKTKGRDVFGLSKAGTAWVKRQAWAKWEQYKAGVLKEEKKLVGAAPGIPKIGNYNTEHATFGIGVSSADQFSTGQWTGGLTHEQLVKHFRQTASANVQARPGQRYNRLLAHVWGQGPGPGRGGSAAPPTPRTGPRKPAQPPKWKPVMTAAEAAAWAKNSVVKGVQYHVTMPESAKAISKQGFRLDVGEATGRVWGNGVYVTDDKKAISFYGGNFPAAATLKLRVNVRKVFEFDATGELPDENGLFLVVDDGLKQGKRYDELRKAIESRNDQLIKELKAEQRKDSRLNGREAGNEWLSQRGYVNGDIEVKRAAFQKLMAELGYDALKIIERGKVSGSVGGTQLVVFNPKHVTVIK